MHPDLFIPPVSSVFGAKSNAPRAAAAPPRYVPFGDSVDEAASSELESKSRLSVHGSTLIEVR